MNTGSSKMMERSFQLITSITKVCLFRCSLGVFMENFFGGEMSYHQVSCLFLRSYLINYRMGPYHLLWTQLTILSLIGLTIVPFEISPLISNDETLLNGLKYNFKKGAENFLLVESAIWDFFVESVILDFGIRNAAQGIWNPTMD